MSVSSACTLYEKKKKKKDQDQDPCVAEEEEGSWYSGCEGLMVQYVDSVEGLRECRRVMEESHVVCMDAEWPPDGVGVPSASVLQLGCLASERISSSLSSSSSSLVDSTATCSDYSTHSKVFVIDVYVGDEDEGYKEYLKDDVFKWLMKNGDVLKVGHSLDADVKAVSVALGCVGVSVHCAVDVTQLFTRLSRHRHSSKSNTTNEWPVSSFKMKGLSSIVDTVLGMQLDKRLQCSAWGKRPLDGEQVVYAANDVACLIDLFLVACRMYCDGHGFDHGYWRRMRGFCGGGKQHGEDCMYYDSHCIETGVREFGQEWRWNEHGKLIKTSESEFWRQPQRHVVGGGRRKKILSAAGGGGGKKTIYERSVLPVYIPWIHGVGHRKDDIIMKKTSSNQQRPRFICDVMLQGLARQLRLWGIDCEHTTVYSNASEKYLTHRFLVETAEESGRVILTKDRTLYDRRLSDQLYFVASMDKKTQGMEVVETFGIDLVQDKFLSRCVKCNGSFGETPVSPASLPLGHDVPHQVCEQFNEFWVCSNGSCGNVYWKGGQFDRTMEHLLHDFKRMSVNT